MNRGRFGSVLLLTFSVAVLLSVGSCGTANLTPINDACICPGDTLQFNCTAVGSGITIWTGTAFTRIACTPISLNHIQFQDLINSGQSRFCPGMTIVVRPLSVVNDCYTSQLTLPSVTAEFNGSTVTCQQDNVQTNEIGTYTVMYTTEPFPPPNNVSLASISNNDLTFTWENVAPTCRSLTYGITSSGCGTCPTTANSTLATCSGVRLRGSVETCTISVQAITCGNIPGSYSQPLSTELQAANAPTVTIIPRYSQSTSYLTSFTAVIEEVVPVSISGNDVMVQSLQVGFRTNDLPPCSSSFTQPCDFGRCQGELNVTISSCTINADSIVTVDVSAVSVLGMGPPTTSRIDGSSENFVRVTSNIENTTRLTVTCEFTNQLDSSNKSCNVAYGLCGQQLSEMAQGVSSSEEPNIARVVLDLSDAATMYCFSVTASNDTFTASIDGTSAVTDATTTEVGGTSSEAVGGGGLDDSAIAGIVIVVVICPALGAIGVVAALILGLKYCRDRKIPLPVTDPNQSGLPLEAVEEEKSHVHFNPDPNDSAVQVEYIAASITSAGLPDDSLRASEAQTSPYTDEEMKKLFEKHPNQVPVAIARYHGDETLEPMDKKYWAPEDWTMDKLGKKIRKDLGLKREQPLYLTVDNKSVVEGSLNLKEVYDTNWHRRDMHLHVAYSSKDITLAGADLTDVTDVHRD